VPRLVLQGTKDSFGTADEIRSVIGSTAGIRLVELPGADHGYRLAKANPFTPADLRATVVAEVSALVLGISPDDPC
jgi:predicted alpha/beta-hydrolase family hydrolase